MNYQKIGDFIHLFTDFKDRKRFEMEILYHAGGSYFEAKTDRGRKHLLEHCIVSRTKKMDFEALQDFQFANNLHLNAFTGPLSMGLNGVAHFSDAKKLADILLEVAFEPTFDQKILDQEKEIVLREIAERSGDPNYILHYATMEQVFTPESYENHHVLGDSELVATTRLEDFQRLHQENLANSHILIIASGGKNEMQEYLIQYLTSLNKSLNQEKNKPKYPLTFDIPSQLQNFSQKPIVHKLAHEHADITFYLPCKINFENRSAIKILEELYLKFHGHLYDLLRNKKGLIYSMQSYFDHSNQTLQINLASEISNFKSIQEQVVESFSNFEKTFNSSKFEQLRDILYKKTDIVSDSLSTLCKMSRDTLQTYGVYEDIQDYLQNLQATTTNDIQKVYHNIQNELNNMKISIVSKDPSIEEFAR